MRTLSWHSGLASSRMVHPRTQQSAHVQSLLADVLWSYVPCHSVVENNVACHNRCWQPRAQSCTLGGAVGPGGEHPFLDVGCMVNSRGQSPDEIHILGSWVPLSSIGAVAPVTTTVSTVRAHPAWPMATPQFPNTPQDLIIHVRDLSHPDTELQKATVLSTLSSLRLPSRLLTPSWKCTTRWTWCLGELGRPWPLWGQSLRGVTC